MKRDRAKFVCIILTAALSIIAAAGLGGQEKAAADFKLTIDNIMRGEELVGAGPSGVTWSHDGNELYFRWKKPGEKTAEFYAMSKTDPAPRKITAGEMMKRPPLPVRTFGDLSEFGGMGGGARAVFDKAKKRALIVEGGDLKIMNLKTGTVKPLITTDARESDFQFSFDQKKVVFTLENNVYLFSLEDQSLRQMTSFTRSKPPEGGKPTDIDKWYADQQVELFQQFKKGQDQARGRGMMPPQPEDKQAPRRKPYVLAENQELYMLDLTPDESSVLFIVSEPVSGVKDTIVPDYVTRTGYTETIPAHAKAAYSYLYDGKMGLMSTTTGDVKWLDAGLSDRKINHGGAIWSPDGKKALVTVFADDRKDEWLFLLDPASAKVGLIENIHDDAWVGHLGLADIFWAPDSQSVFYISEKDGYAHIYQASLDGKNKKQLTSGRFEVRDFQLSADGKKIYFTSSEVHPGELHYYSMPVEGGARTKITAMTGQYRVVLSPDETTLAALFSTSTRPAELYIQPNRPGAPARQVTISTTEEFRSYAWYEPEVLTFRARDGVDVYARLFKPQNPHPQRPAVIFIHGAGYLQNAHKGWSINYYREYMFHNILIENGYHVIDVDYRGSSGYGRDCRTAIYRHMGGKDLDDIVDAAKFLVQNYNVNPAKIGCYGGSYGGFLTLMAMFTSADTFRAGAALRPAIDWAHYHAGYTVDILNLPQKDAEAYKKSSPIYFAEGLKGALLICHGMVDTNVHFQDTVRLAQRLIELGKENWEVAIFPVENHSFVNPTSWADEYKRIFKLFETNLKN